MSPAIDTGDFIIDNPDHGATNLRRGQIITFYDSPGSPTVITHRIVAVLHQSGGVFYRTKGDNNPAADLALRPSRDVIGLYKVKIPRGGYFLTNLHRPIVLGLLLAAPLLWLIAGILRSYAKTQDEPTPPPLQQAAAASSASAPIQSGRLRDRRNRKQSVVQMKR
jgi:signal peptidase I